MQAAIALRDPDRVGMLRTRHEASGYLGWFDLVVLLVRVQR